MKSKIPSTIFDNPAGARVLITTQVASAEMHFGVKDPIKQNVTYWATATDEYQTMPDGVRRRLFKDASIDFGGFGREIWLTDGKVI